jgi:hypothetical protein
VEFHESSRVTVNQSLADVGMCVPERKQIVEDEAWGGCLLFDRRVSVEDMGTLRGSTPIHVRQWIVPESTVMATRVREGTMKSGYEGEGPGNPNPSNSDRLLPVRILTINGFELVLKVAKSSIANAGFGVFASCVPLFHQGREQSAFELRSGDLLDLGVYAPCEFIVHLTCWRRIRLSLCSIVCSAGYGQEARTHCCVEKLSTGLEEPTVAL